jgi:acyl carrier protein
MEYLDVVRSVARSQNLLDEAGRLSSLDSLSIVDFVTELEASAGIEIPTTSMRAEEFESLETIAALLKRLAA